MTVAILKPKTFKLILNFMTISSFAQKVIFEIKHVKICF